jgi:hypothetical protein
MYSESDIEAAIATGAITPAAAAALRDSVAQSRAAPAVDEESFRLITGFNDIFVTIAALLLLVAVGWIGFSMFGPGPATPEAEIAWHIGLGTAVAGLLVAAASWALAEYFTRRRRMALPSIVLLAAFVYAVAATIFGFGMAVFGQQDHNERLVAAIVSVAGLVTAGGAYLHWRRFHVPITIAALTAALVATLVALFGAAFPAIRDHWLWVLLVAGVGVFAFAMWWDMSDRTRQTRRSDVAFWLHLSAAPMIAHPVFNLLGVLNNDISAATGLVVILLYVAFGIVALAVDRRALLVSSLVYVLYALAGLFKQAGAVSLNIALTALVIGSALLLLSAFWHSVRRIVVLALPGDLQARLPALDRPVTVTPRLV